MADAMKENRMTRKSMRPLGALLTAGLALSACDKVDDATNAATGGGVLKGTVKDSYGKPVEGAQVVVYTYSQNLGHFYRPEEVPDTSALTDPSTYKVKVDLGELVAGGEPETEIGTSGADGAFEISGLPALDGIIVVAKKNGYALDIAGVDDEGYISLASALRPSSVDQNELTATIKQDFVLAGGKPPFADGGGDVVPPDVIPVPPPGAPPPPPPPDGRAAPGARVSGQRRLRSGRGLSRRCLRPRVHRGHGRGRLRRRQGLPRGRLRPAVPRPRRLRGR
jgi:hypothetical protein